MSAEDLKPLPFWDAVEFMRRRGVVLPDVYYGALVGVQRANAFSVAGIMAYDMIERIQASLESAIEEGETYQSWRDRVMKDQLALNLPEWRYEVIYRTNIQSMYQRGRQAEQIDYGAPYLMYDAVGDSRTRPSHLEMDNIVLPADHPFWDEHRPLNGYNCRCDLIGIIEDELEEVGGITQKLPDSADVEPDDGWNYSMVDDPHRGNRLAVERRMEKEPKMARFLPEAFKPPGESGN